MKKFQWKRNGFFLEEVYKTSEGWVKHFSYGERNEIELYVLKMSCETDCISLDISVWDGTTDSTSLKKMASALEGIYTVNEFPFDEICTLCKSSGF